MTETDHFESGIATLAADSTPEFDSSAPFEVSGVAIPVNTIVRGGRGVEHFYTAEVLQGAGELLENTTIVKNFHSLEGQAEADEVIGKVTNAGFQKGIGLVFEGEITDEDIAEKIAHGFLDVSPSPARSLGEFDQDMGAQRVERLAKFRDVAVVANGQPGAKIEIGPNPAVSTLGMDALSRSFDTLQNDMAIHTPEFDGTADREWNAPNLSDFTDSSWEELDEEAKGAIEAHYLGSKSGFPAENFTDLFLPVVEPDGTLNLNALANAKARAGQVEGLSGDDLDTVVATINELANNNFEDADFDTQSDDGAQEESPQSSADGEENTETETMSNDLTEEEKAVLAAADDVEGATDVLRSYAAAEQPEIVESDTLSEKEDTIEELASVFRDALSERTGLSEDTVNAMPVDALCNEFRNDEGEIEPETLNQSPETGTVENDEEPSVDALSKDDKEEVQDLLRRADLLEQRTPDHADTLRSQAADLAGVDDPDEIELEVM
jgi:hypothetical protein